MDDFEKLLFELDIKFNNLDIFKRAFMHSSYVNEHNNENLEDNERLEYLGDAVLDMIVSEYLFKKGDLSEGEMSKLRANYVCENALFTYAKKLNFDVHVLLGKGEFKSKGFNSPRILSGVFEAFIASIYLDSGLNSVIKFFDKFIVPIIDENKKEFFTDYKTKLQEIVQSENKTLQYVTIEELGEPHNREFVVAVKVGRKILSKGIGKSKKDAEREAAKLALLTLEKNKKI